MATQAMAFKFVPAKDLESWLRSYGHRRPTFQQTAAAELNSVLGRPAEEEAQPAPTLCRAQSCASTDDHP